VYYYIYYYFYYLLYILIIVILKTLMLRRANQNRAQNRSGDRVPAHKESPTPFPRWVKPQPKRKHINVRLGNNFTGSYGHTNRTNSNPCGLRTWVKHAYTAKTNIFPKADLPWLKNPSSAQPSMAWKIINNLQKGPQPGPNPNSTAQSEVEKAKRII
jgi:hypothetical protein